LNRILFLTIICFFAASCGRANSTSDKKNSETKSEELNIENTDSIAAPDFTLEDVYGNKHTLSNYKGKVVLINFWAIYCPSCRLEISNLMKLYEKYEDDRLVFLGVGFDKDKNNLKAFSNLNKINYPILAGDKEIATKYRIIAVPTTFIMNEKGELTDTIIGYNNRLGKKIEDRLLELLKNKDE
jgi:cytochrome c-type biogenesis protein